MFQIGDTVRLLRPLKGNNNQKIPKGTLGKVVHEMNSNVLLVQIDPEDNVPYLIWVQINEIELFSQLSLLD